MSDEINWWQEEINRQSAVIQTMLDELRAATIAGNDQRAQALNAILEASRQIYATMAEENQTRRESLMPLRLELSAAMLDEVTKLSGALDLLLAAVRKDIGVDTNVSDRLKFLAAARIDVPRLRSQYDAFVAELTSSANESARQDS